MLMDAVLTVLLLAPPVVIAVLWRLSVRPANRRPGHLPDSATIVLARLGAVVCAALPVAQLIASIFRYRTGEMGLYLWFLVPGFGVLLAMIVLPAFLSHARGYERTVSPGMLLLSTGMLMLLTFVGDRTGS